MRKDINIIFIIVILLFPFNNINSQTGINTKSPASNTILHVDGMKDNSNGLTSSVKNDVIISTSGRLGIGTHIPKTKIDVRSSVDQTGIFAVGATTQSPSEVGGGAVRYNTVAKVLEYSDGEKWHELPLKAPTKAMVLARKTSSQSVTNNSTTQITNWSTVTDLGGDFNLDTGVFTARRDGFYVVSFNITIDSGPVLDNSKIETLIESDNTSENIQTFKSIDSFPGDESGTVNTYVGSGCNAIFNLKKGNTIRFKVYHTLGQEGMIIKRDKVLYIGSGSDSGKYNTVSVYEL